jgi:hypothetical protein
MNDSPIFSKDVLSKTVNGHYSVMWRNGWECETFPFTGEQFRENAESKALSFAYDLAQKIGKENIKIMLTKTDKVWPW